MYKASWLVKFEIDGVKFSETVNRRVSDEQARSLKAYWGLNLDEEIRRGIEDDIRAKIVKQAREIAPRWKKLEIKSVEQIRRLTPDSSASETTTRGGK